MYAQKINNSGEEPILRIKWEVQTVNTKEVESAVCLWVVLWGSPLKGTYVN